MVDSGTIRMLENAPSSLGIVMERVHAGDVFLKTSETMPDDEPR